MKNVRSSSTKVLLIRMDSKMKEEIRKAADASYRDLSGYVKLAIRERLDRDANENNSRH